MESIAVNVGEVYVKIGEGEDERFVPFGEIRDYALTTLVEEREKEIEQEKDYPFPLNEKEIARRYVMKEKKFDYMGKDFYSECRLCIRYIMWNIREEKGGDGNGNGKIIFEDVKDKVVKWLKSCEAPNDFIWSRDSWINRVIREEIANETKLYDKDEVSVPVEILDKIIKLDSAKERKLMFTACVYVLYHRAKTGGDGDWVIVDSRYLKSANCDNLSKRQCYETLHLLYERGYINTPKKIDGDAIKVEMDKLMENRGGMYLVEEIKDLDNLGRWIENYRKEKLKKK